jgi:NADH-quinone oxidoreductase subunit G
VPIYFADPLARRAAGVAEDPRCHAAPTARMNTTDAGGSLASTDGVLVRVRQGAGEAVLEARSTRRCPPACVRVAAAHVSTAALGDMFGAINVERA